MHCNLLLYDVLAKNELCVIRLMFSSTEKHFPPRHNHFSCSNFHNCTKATLFKLFDKVEQIELYSMSSCSLSQSVMTTLNASLSWVDNDLTTLKVIGAPSSPEHISLVTCAPPTFSIYTQSSLKIPGNILSWNSGNPGKEP